LDKELNCPLFQKIKQINGYIFINCAVRDLNIPEKPPLHIREVGPLYMGRAKGAAVPPESTRDLKRVISSFQDCCLREIL
jgi:hypothetical protein